MKKTEAAGSFSRRAPRRPTALWVVALTLAGTLAQVVGAALPAAAASDAKIEAGLLDLPDDKTVDFWVTFGAKADVGTTAKGRGWTDRGQVVVDGLQRTASTSQAGVARLLAARGITFESYWIANTVKIRGPKSLMRLLATRPEVAKVEADRALTLPEPAPAADVAPAAVEWNLTAINAPAVWSDLSVTGQGIVVANLDTGVQFDHPALVNQYRGNLGGTFDHNYNWFDPSNVCGSPSVVPCDNNRHGTHTMGTMVGEAVAGLSAIGVAPGARWIAVKGCESSSCSQSALLAGGQWLLAPTDLNGQNPRPDLRPNIVNNSWGGPGGSTWYRDIVTAWVAAGIFPVFSNGNSGPYCGSAGSPADYAESYAVGAHNSAGGIASFSSRGSATGPMKPDITAPGDVVRSSVPGGGYTTLSGTSMAAPHVSGTVALMWSAAPSLIGDVAGTRAILDASAADVSDLTCGGTAADNAVWGEGRLDALAAVQRSPRGPVGTVSGTVVDSVTGLPVAGAQVRSVGADTFPRITTTGPTGTFSQLLVAGVVQMQVTAYGYVAASTQVTLAADTTQVVDFGLVPQPRHALGGRVLDYLGAPVASASVSIVGVPIQPVVTDPAGVFLFPAIPAGDLNLSASGGFCLGAATKSVHLDADATVDLTLPLKRDAFGYSCRTEPPAYVDAGTVVPLTGNDSFLSIALPFPFSYYGKSYSTVQVSANGLVSMGAGSSIWNNRPIPDTAVPNATIYAFWEDLYIDGLSSVRTQSLGAEPDRRFVIEWRNVRFWSGTSARFDFEAILDQRGGIVLEYRNLSDDALIRGASATIGIEDETGTVGLAYSYNQPSLTGSAAAVRFDAAGSAGNTPPDAVADSAATVAGRMVAVPILANDIDPDGDPVTVTGVSSPNGYSSLNGGVLTYTPYDHYSGPFLSTQVVTYDLADNRGGTDRGTVTISVAQLGFDDTVAAVEDTPVDIPVLANDLNPQGGVLAIETLGSPAHGSVAQLAGGVIRYTPNANFSGTDTFVYSVLDGLGGRDRATVNLVIAAVDDPPQAGNDTAVVAQDDVTTVNVLANDSDADGEPLQVVAVSDPPHGTAGVNPDRTVTYRPDAGYAGADSFTYDISDGHTVARGTVTVTVRAAATTTTTSTTLPPSTTTTTTRPPGPATATIKAPYSVWTQASPGGLDGVGTWLDVLKDPAAGVGQAAPEYLYGMFFGFASSPVQASLGLSTGPGGKTAFLSVSGAGVAPQHSSIPFAWTADHFYFVFVMEVGPGTWGALVYDLQANAWTPIGTIVVPVAWGKLSPTSVTATLWAGAPSGACSAYPAGTIIVHAPTGFRAGKATDATYVQGGTGDGTCRSDYLAAGSPGWYLYGTGTP